MQLMQLKATNNVNTLRHERKLNESKDRMCANNTEVFSLLHIFGEFVSKIFLSNYTFSHAKRADRSLIFYVYEYSKNKKKTESFSLLTDETF